MLVPREKRWQSRSYNYNDSTERVVRLIFFWGGGGGGGGRGGERVLGRGCLYIIGMNVSW